MGLVRLRLKRAGRRRAALCVGEVGGGATFCPWGRLLSPLQEGKDPDATGGSRDRHLHKRSLSWEALAINAVLYDRNACRVADMQARES